jgi:FAD synthase
VSLDQIVSSTRIREAIRAGNLDAASQMLGRPYAISGRVIAGDGVGRKLGFPTANLDATGLVLPPNGVYASVLPKSKKNHQPVALNIGVRPTLAIRRRRNCAWRRICWILAATFTAGNWKSKSAKSCATSGNLVRLKN